MIILGSTSPRRKQLLKLLTSNFKTIAPLYDEKKLSLQTEHYALEESIKKSESLRDLISNNDCLITSDTIVFFNGKIYGKPKNTEEAFEMLKTLNNHQHSVISGYTIVYRNKIIKKEVISKVTFNNFSDEKIREYISSVSVLDKAGAYSVQDDEKYHLIKKVDGSFYNVMGFPLENIKKDLICLKLI